MTDEEIRLRSAHAMAIIAERKTRRALNTYLNREALRDCQLVLANPKAPRWVRVIASLKLGAIEAKLR